MNTNEKRKAGPCSIWGGISVGLVILFELAYIMMASMPDGAIFSHFSPQISAEDRAMLESNIPGHKSAKKKPKKKPVPKEAATAVDAALQAHDLPGGDLQTNAVSGVLTGANRVQWTVTDTNAFQKLINATNDVPAEGESVIAPESVVPPESSNTVEKITVPVG